MMPPAKYMSFEESSVWAVALSELAFRKRVSRFNKRQESKLKRTFLSTAKKWREYYSHDSGRSRFVIYAPFRTDKEKMNMLSPADTFRALQNENVNTLDFTPVVPKVQPILGNDQAYEN